MLSLFALVLALVAGVLDARGGKIPNWLTLGGLAVALALSPLGGSQGAALSFAGMIFVGFVPCLLFFLTRGAAIGGGGGGLWAALGACLGPDLGLAALLWSLAILLLYALFRAAARGSLFRLLAQTARHTIGRGDPASVTTLRFGPAIALGTCLVLLVEKFPALPLLF